MRAKLGSVYQRKKKLPDGTQQVLPTWWVKYHKNGKVFRESSGSEKRADAERLLKKRAGEIVTGKFLGLASERIAMAELFEDVVEDYQSSERATLGDLKSRLKNHLHDQSGTRHCSPRLQSSGALRPAEGSPRSSHSDVAGEQHPHWLSRIRRIRGRAGSVALVCEITFRRGLSRWGKTG
jgi:hypothetical protein